MPTSRQPIGGLRQIVSPKRSDPENGLKSRAYCESELRRHDYDRYLASLMLSGDVRRAATAIYAFNLEIARTREIVSESLLGEMRIQFWRDMVDGLYSGNHAPEHPVAQELGWAIMRHNLPKAPIERLLAARQRDLEDAPPRSIEDLESYVDGTSTALLELLMRAADPNATPASDTVGHIGVAFGLSGLLRAVPFHARQHRLYLPADALASAGIDAAQVFGCTFSMALASAIEIVAARARERLARARLEWRDVPRQQRQVLLVGSVAAVDLRRLQKFGHDPYHPRLQVSPLRRLFQFGRARLVGLG